MTRDGPDAMIGWIESKFRSNIPESLPYTNPLHAGRHPFQTFILVLCVVSGAPLIAGHVAAGSIESSLPQWAALAWGASLVLGAALALVGSFWRGKYDTALLMERVGLNFVGFAAVIYAGVIVLVGGWSGTLVAAGIVLGFGCACLARVRDIARIFARANDVYRPRIQGEGE